MDPDQCLAEIRELLDLAKVAEQRHLHLSNQDDVLSCLLERIDAMDGWLTNGGYPPAAWRPTAL